MRFICLFFVLFGFSINQANAINFKNFYELSECVDYYNSFKQYKQNLTNCLKNQKGLKYIEDDYITPKEIISARKQFRTSVIVRNIYSEVLNIIQAATMRKISQKKYYNIKEKKYLNDALMTSIAGISAAMKNTG